MAALSHNDEALDPMFAEWIGGPPLGMQNVEGCAG